jgi:multidrug efflux system membrane fusion protein
MQRPLRYLIWSLGLAMLAGSFAWRARGRPSSPRSSAADAVRVVQIVARQSNLPVQIDALGTVTPVHTVSLASQVNGQVLAVHYQEGQLVRQGELLIEIDPRQFQATLLQAQGTLARDQALLAQARMDLARYQHAWAKNAISKQQLDDQQKLVQQTKGAVKTDLGVVQYDQAQLDFARIRAPLAGRIGLRLIDPGNVLTAASGTTLAVITQVQPISVVFTISEDDLGEVLRQTRAGATLGVDALDRKRTRTIAHGTLSALDNQIDTTTGTVKARAVFENADEALFPNQFVNARLTVRTIEGATTLPTSAVQHDGSQAFVYVIQDQRAHVQKVQTGVVQADTAQVEGIAPGTVVANGGFDKLRDGVLVAAAEAPSAAPEPGAGSARP